MSQSWLGEINVDRIPERERRIELAELPKFIDEVSNYHKWEKLPRFGRAAFTSSGSIGIGGGGSSFIRCAMILICSTTRLGEGSTLQRGKKKKNAGKMEDWWSAVIQ